jgi:hypothetical protein
MTDGYMQVVLIILCGCGASRATLGTETELGMACRKTGHCKPITQKLLLFIVSILLTGTSC